jgi:hypothetical protein
MSDDAQLPLQATVKVNPGVCRMHTTIQARTDGMRVEFSILNSECPQVRKLENLLNQMDMGGVMKMPYSENTVYKLCGSVLNHSSCPVPMAMIKCAEAAAELALKRTVTVEFVP